MKRSTIERAINGLKQHRAVATRSDKRGYVYLGASRPPHCPAVLERECSTPSAALDVSRLSAHEVVRQLKLWYSSRTSPSLLVNGLGVGSVAGVGQVRDGLGRPSRERVPTPHVVTTDRAVHRGDQ